MPAARTPRAGVQEPQRERVSVTATLGIGWPSAAGIRYSWRLILGPYEVMDYVVAHECGHLVHADHSPRFWAVVKQLRPDMARQRAWLRSHGSKLHALGR